MSTNVDTKAAPEVDIYTRRESNVRSYCRSFPGTFSTAQGSTLRDAAGRPYLDFLAGAGALNYGHNHPRLKSVLVEHVLGDGVAHLLDFHTSAKARFLEAFETRVLAPKGLPYVVQFTGPTGANAVEAALKIARRVTGRTGIFSYMGGYHGHSLGGLATTANREHRAAAGLSLTHTTFLPFPGSSGAIDTHGYLRMILEDGHSGIEVPAAIIVETVQAEGGVFVAPTPWLRELRAICNHHGIVLIVDEIQTGCGRTGPFFSFERAGIVPDIVAVSKSISGFGLPMALTLIRPELDIWKPAEHTGTFRGNQLAFVTGAEALAIFDDESLASQTADRGRQVQSFIDQVVLPLDPRITSRGIGLIWGIDLGGIDATGAFTKQVARRCFEQGLIIERVGRNDTVLKILPPLTITADEMADGLARIADALTMCLAERRAPAA